MILKQAEQFAWRLAIQQMSPTIRLEPELHPSGTAGTIHAFDASRPNDHLYAGGGKVGELMWHPGGVGWVGVHPDYRRQGVGAAMWQKARSLDPSIQHSQPQMQSPAGSAWAQAVG